MKETQKHKDAFEHFYLKLNEKNSVNDSIISVAENFGVTERTVWGWKTKLKWDDKVAVRDSEIQKGLEDKTNTTIVDNKAKYLGIVHFSLNKYVEEVNSGKRDPIPIENSRDLERLIKTGLLIQNQPTEISEQNGSVNHEHTITDVITDPHDRATLTEIAARSRVGQVESSGSGDGDNS